MPSPTPLLLLLDVPCLDLKSLFLCRLARVHQDDCSSFTRKSTSPPRSCLPSATFDFHSEVTSPLKNVLASAPLTFTHKSLHCCLHPIREGLPLWHGSLLWRSHPALASLILPSGATHPGAQDTHCGLGFARGAVSAQILPQSATRPTGQGRTLLFPILFVEQIPAQLSSSLLPGATLLK